MHPIPNIPVPLLQSSVEQFTNQLFGTTSSKFLPTPPREPTPPRDESKRKGIATEESLKDIMPFMEEGGSIPKISSLKSFVLPEGPLSQEKVMALLKEMKRLADLKEQEKKSEEELKKMLNPATLKAQALKWEEHEEKKAKMLKEFNKCISERTNPLTITKISYVNSSKTATIRITRDKDPLNLTVYPYFRLECCKVPMGPQPILKEVFVTQDIRVDGMDRNLIPPPGVMLIQGLVINEHESGIFFMNGNTDIAFQRESEFHLTLTVQLIRIQI
ncbi:hypothetical protein Tco_0471412 [Tanacetum coccineum]